MKRKKLLINASMYGDDPTGVGIHVREIANRLPALLPDFDIECYAYSSNLDPSLNVRLVALPSPLERVVLRRAFHRLIWNFFVLPKIARDFDVVYAGSSHGSANVKSQVITVHDLICLAFPKQHAFQSLYFRRLLPAVLRSSRKVITVSNFTNREVRKEFGLPPQKVVTVYNGGDHLTPRHDVELEGKFDYLKSNRFFLVVGCSYPHKNVENVIDAFRGVQADCRLVIVGVGNSYSVSLVSRAASDPRITFLPFAQRADLSWLYRHALAHVYVSLYEGFGLPPYEAALNGTVSIVSDIPALSEIYGSSVHYVDPLEMDQLRNAMAAFLDNRIELAKYREKFPALIERYRWDDAARQVAELIREV